VKYLDEYRDAAGARRLLGAITRATTRPWTLMEVCGGQTHSLLRYGIDRLLPASIELVHGPGCPVCVTSVALIDKAIEIALAPGAILTSFGDMLRVPGSARDLLSVRAAGGDVRMVYSPLDAVGIARENPEREVVFFAVGFETTAPTTALAVLRALREGLRNFRLLVAHVRVPPALRAILEAPGNRVQGLLAPGHVCTVMGFEEYATLSERYRVPIVVTGFEPIDLLQGIRRCVAQLEAGRAEVENAYARSVRREGNERAQQLIGEVFDAADRDWRGLGCIPGGGLALRPAFDAFDAETRFGRAGAGSATATEAEGAAAECIAGLVLQGVKKPVECPAFGTRCAPEHPLGAPMVSSEGACAAYHRYRRDRDGG
jgi:hydrogenase expression/formation protein HypD